MEAMKILTNGKVIKSYKNEKGITLYKVETLNEEDSLTEHAQAQEADVNYIMDKYKKTGHLPVLRAEGGTYSDITQVPDLASALETVTKAQEAFDALPAHIREKFGNSPVLMTNFLSDPKNLPEAVKLGLAEEIAPEKPIQVEIKEKPEKSEKHKKDRKSVV